MHSLVVAILLSQVAAQSQPAAVSQQPCVILRRMGTADQITSRFFSLGIQSKQFQFVEGQFPEGIKFRGRLNDKDVQKIQDRGGRITVVEARYTTEELERARDTCSNSGHASKSPASDPPAPDPPKPGSKPAVDADPPKPGGESAKETAGPPRASGGAPAAQPAATSAQTLTVVAVKSSPEGADITVDGKYVGDTPSTVRLAPGDHIITIEKPGFRSWQRTITASPGGIVTLNPTLDKLI